MTESKALSPLLSLRELLLAAARVSALKKCVCSKPTDPAVVRGNIVCKTIGGKTVWQAETMQKNIPMDDTVALDALLTGYGQINLLTTAGEAEYRCNKSGHAVLLGGDKVRMALLSGTATMLPAESNNREKTYILRGDEPFLRLLGVSDEKGRVHDKKTAKFRQINRFLELVRDVENRLPAEGVLHICDLCCGKSYLSFAIYHYFANIKGREVCMRGVDLKPDVMQTCNGIAEALHFDGLHFSWGDVGAYEAEGPVDMVVSLHACDTATDLVLSKAMAWGASVILSTPCCQHELNHTVNCPELSFLTEHSMLRQKFCEAATDALRLKLLEANGYTVAALELIDPEETPKNIMLRAIRRKNFDPSSPEAAEALAEYESARAFLLQPEKRVGVTGGTRLLDEKPNLQAGGKNIYSSFQ